jgi:hypothetical protein
VGKCAHPRKRSVAAKKAKNYENTLLALLGLILLSTPLAATAQQLDDFTYLSDGSAITITGYTGPGGDVPIPASINGITDKTDLRPENRDQQ